MRWRAAALATLLVAAAPISGPALAAADPQSQAADPEIADPLFQRRWESLIAGGYEPLTIPTDWYDPVATVPGAPGAVATILPEKAGVSPTALTAAAAWAETQNSSALIVARDGRIVFERYWQGTGRDTLFNPQSMSKTVLALLVGTAVARGELAASDKVERFLTEWRGQPRGGITIEQMLWMSAGLEQGDAGYGYTVSADNPIVRHSIGSDLTRLPLSLQPVAEPGTVFDYNNQVNQLLGIILERATGMRYPQLLSERLWKPLGLRDAAMPLDREGGMVMTSCCILSRPVDWVRVGQLILDNGMAGGRRLVPADWIAAMLRPSPGYAGYGYQVWIGDQKVGGKPEDRPGLVPWQSEAFADGGMVMLHGHGGQRVYIMPTRKLVVIRAARQWPTAWDDALLPNIIWRGTLPLGDSE